MCNISMLKGDCIQSTTAAEFLWMMLLNSSTNPDGVGLAIDNTGVIKDTRSGEQVILEQFESVMAMVESWKPSRMLGHVRLASSSAVHGSKSPSLDETHPFYAADLGCIIAHNGTMYGGPVGKMDSAHFSEVVFRTLRGGKGLTEAVQAGLQEFTGGAFVFAISYNNEFYVYRNNERLLYYAFSTDGTVVCNTNKIRLLNMICHDRQIHNWGEIKLIPEGGWMLGNGELVPMASPEELVFKKYTPAQWPAMSTSIPHHATTGLPVPGTTSSSQRGSGIYQASQAEIAEFESILETFPDSAWAFIADWARSCSAEQLRAVLLGSPASLMDVLNSAVQYSLGGELPILDLGDGD